MQAKVSVIVPIYNCEKYISKCLKSLINQSLEDIEIICVDNNSTDNSLNIVQNFAKKDSRIIICKEEKQGLSSARNKGCEVATGEYLGFVDSDDWVCDDFFEKLYNFAKLYNADISCGSIRRLGFLYNSVKLFYKEAIYSENTQEKINLTGIPATNYVWNKIYKRDKFNSLNLRFKDGILFEDIEFSIRAVHQMGGLVVVPKTEYLYRYRRNSIVNSFKKNKEYISYASALASCQKYAIENSIDLKNTQYFPKKKSVKIWNFTLWKTYYYSERCIIHKLFGFIPLIYINKY